MMCFVLFSMFRQTKIFSSNETWIKIGECPHGSAGCWAYGVLDLRGAGDHPHGEVLGAAAVGVAKRDAGAVYLVLAGPPHHLHGRLAETQQARGADRVRGQHAAGGG